MKERERTCAILMMGLSLGVWRRYKGLPIARTTKPTAVAMVDMKNPQYQPLSMLTETIAVTPTVAPMVALNRSQLKKVGKALASLGTLTSNWSAPNAGREPLTPPEPSANKYSDV